jgi:hypothetical protein
MNSFILILVLTLITFASSQQYLATWNILNGFTAPVSGAKGEFIYSQSGNVVTVSGGTIATASPGYNSATLTLPIQTNFTTISQALGTISGTNSVTLDPSFQPSNGFVTSVQNGHNVQLEYFTVNGGESDLFFIFQYLIV